MSTSEIAFHDLSKVLVENVGDNWMEIELINSKGLSISITVFGNRDPAKAGAFVALRHCLMREFAPTEVAEEVL